ncbi:hypothetical protein [Mangrovibacter sp. MFB070]|uniref:hypothetical protein n=1 Tax=Mangrovibacter sp. MFB070 TaxID=1224318 RepID=UPI00136481F3|nr:hypothetical protein [Mangrovibacter sp. MFB070]
MRNVTAQVRHVLRLCCRIPYGDAAVAHRRTRQRLRTPAVVYSGQQAVRHIADKISSGAPARAEPHALVFNPVIRFPSELLTK